jgi:hypothetical protein
MVDRQSDGTARTDPAGNTELAGPMNEPPLASDSITHTETLNWPDCAKCFVVVVMLAD